MAKSSEDLKSGEDINSVEDLKSGKDIKSRYKNVGKSFICVYLLICCPVWTSIHSITTSDHALHNVANYNYVICFFASLELVDLS